MRDTQFGDRIERRYRDGVYRGVVVELLGKRADVLFVSRDGREIRPFWRFIVREERGVGTEAPGR